MTQYFAVYLGVGFVAGLVTAYWHGRTSDDYLDGVSGSLMVVMLWPVLVALGAVVAPFWLANRLGRRSLDESRAGDV